MASLATDMGNNVDEAGEAEVFKKFKALGLKPKDPIKIRWGELPIKTQKIYDAKITNIYTPTKKNGYRVVVNYANYGGRETISMADFMKRIVVSNESARKKRKLAQLCTSFKILQKFDNSDLWNKVYCHYSNGYGGMEACKDVSLFFKIRKESIHWWKLKAEGDWYNVKPVALKKWKHLIDMEKLKKYQDDGLNTSYLDHLYILYNNFCALPEATWKCKNNEISYFKNELEVYKPHELFSYREQNMDSNKQTFVVGNCVISWGKILCRNELIGKNILWDGCPFDSWLKYDARIEKIGSNKLVGKIVGVIEPSEFDLIGETKYTISFFPPLGKYFYECVNKERADYLIKRNEENKNTTSSIKKSPGHTGIVKLK